MKIDPLHPDWFHAQLGWALWSAGECAEGAAAFQKIPKIPDVTRKSQAAVLACAGDLTGARAAMDVYLAARPGANLEQERESLARLWTAPGQLDRWLADLATAGLPE